MHSWAKQKAFTIVELLIVIVVIAILAAITIVAYNGITDRAKDSSRVSELTQWKKKAELYKVQNNIECPDGYVFVYGNSTLGTSDFCVMKYEAKNVGGVATSQAAGAPWTNISQTSAITQSTSAGGHLLTDAEWMTIAADVLSVKYNWSGGAVGSGLIYQGHVNNNPASALGASADDSDTLNGITGGIGTSSGNNSSRVLYLSSGDAIWDFSGNVWEWTSTVQVMSQVGVSGDSSFSYRDWTHGSLSLGNLPAGSRPSVLDSYTNTATNVGLGGISWDASTGVGRLYANYSDAASRPFMRGGSWGYGSPTVGVLALHLGLSTTTTNASVGFRVAR